MRKNNTHKVHSWWMGLLILGALAAAVYFIWPPVAVYFGKTTMGTILRKNARSCLSDGKDVCAQAIINEAHEKGIVIDRPDLQISHVTRDGVHYNLSYKAELIYPFTGTMLGSAKHRYKRVHMVVKTEQSGY